MDSGFRARIVSGAKVRGRLLPVTTMEGRSLDHLPADWVAIVLVEWESAARTDILDMYLVEIRGRDGGVLDFLTYGTFDVALDQARAITGIRPDQWLMCDTELGEDPESKLGWMTFRSLARG